MKKKKLLLPLFGCALVAWLPMTVAREVVVLSSSGSVVGPVGVASGVDTQGPGLLLVGAQDINTSNDPGGAITTDAANTASIQFNNSSTVTGFVGTAGSTFLDISAGTNANTVTFNGPVYSTTFSVAGTGTVNFNGGFTSNTGSSMDFAGDGFINVGAGQTVKAAITNTAGASTGTLTLNNNSILDGAVGAASGLKQINVVGGNALITGQANASTYTLGTNTLNVAGAFAIPVAGTINTTIFSTSLYGKIVPVGASTIGNALQVNVTVTGPIPVGSIFNIVDATSGTNGSTVTATSNTTRYLFSAAPTTNGQVQIVATQIPLADVVGPVGNPTAPIIAPVIDALPLSPATGPLLTAITLLPNAKQVADALAQLQPGAASLASPQASYRVTQQFQGLLNSHLEGAARPCSQNDQSDDRHVPGKDDSAACQPGQKHPQLWGAAFGYAGTQENTNGYEGYTDNSAGAMLAYEMPLGQVTTAGVGIRYANTAIDGSSALSHGNIKSHQAMVYLGFAPGRSWFANGSLVYGDDDYSITRDVVFPGFSGHTGAHYSGHQSTAAAATGYHFHMGDGRTTITPMATLQYTHLKTGGYTEAGNGPIDLKVDAQSYDFLQSGLGVKFARNISLSDTRILRPEVHVNWLHSFHNNMMSNTAAFTSGGPAFTTVGVTPERNLYDAGAGIILAASNSWSVEGVYDYQWNHGYRAGQAMIKLTLSL
ncbi:MAG: autotransporter domain-containing protein [Rhodanobacter sp.]|jgi:outer membrane autotransporter protein|nr:autotransporter domain-containing protein [Rhodanobacter sp.]